MLWLLYQLFAVADGFCDALLYGRRGADSFAWNEHRPLTIRRGLVLALGFGAGMDAALMGEGHVGRWPLWLLWLLCEAAACVLSFSLFHNEAYNFGRVWIQQQEFSKAWRVFEFNYQSPTTTARWDFDGPTRWVMAGAAVLVLGVGFLLLMKL